MFKDDDLFITLYMSEVIPFLPEKDARRKVLRYLHDRGIEGDIGKDERGDFIKYYKPPADEFGKFSMQFYEIISGGGK